MIYLLPECDGIKLVLYRLVEAFTVPFVCGDLAFVFEWSISSSQTELVLIPLPVTTVFSSSVGKDSKQPYVVFFIP